MLNVIMLFLIFSHIYNVKMSDVHFNVAKVSNNEVNICRSNPYEQKAPASDCSEHSVSNGFFYFQPKLTPVRDGFLYMDICYMHSAQVQCSAPGVVMPSHDTIHLKSGKV